ncbi:MAG: hypothetical protein JXA54_08125 [Candidatus Heimdallarchaeota archaeon]|nr:hypothetical protein [Candidatus Heimdallarchaeota archaeon]
MFLIGEELKNNTINFTKEILEEDIEVLTNDNANFIFKQVTYFKKQTKKGLTRLAIFTISSMILAFVSIVQFKNYSNLSNLSFLFYVTNLGMLISLNLSLEEISTAYKKYRYSPVKFFTIIGIGLGIILVGFLGHLAYLFESEKPPQDQQIFSAVMIIVTPIILLFVVIIQKVGLITSTIIRAGKKNISIINILITSLLTILSCLFLFYFIVKLKDGILLFLSILFILIQLCIFSFNAFYFNKYGKAEIVITPLRLIWIIADKVEYYRFKEIAKIDFGETNALIYLINGIVEVKELNLASFDGYNKDQLLVIDKITKNYLIKTHENKKEYN